MLAFSNDYYGMIFRATQSVELFCAYPIKEHFIHMGTAKKDMMLKEKIWYLVQDCDERETSLLIYSIEGIKKGLKKYQQDSRK